MVFRIKVKTTQLLLFVELLFTVALCFCSIMYTPMFGFVMVGDCNSHWIALVYSYPVTVNQILLSIYRLNCQPALGPNMVNIIMFICCKNTFSLV